MKQWLVLVTIGAAVLVPYVAYGQSEFALAWKGRDIHLVAAQRVPACAEVLSAYGAEEGDFDALARFLENALPLTAWDAHGVEIWHVTHEFIDLEDGGRKEVFHAYGTIGEHEGLMKLSMENGAFVIHVTRSTGVGDLDTHLEYQILQPQIPSKRYGSDLRNETGIENVQPLYLVVRALSICTCDTSGGGACTDTMCDEIQTCPDKNGTSCGWMASPAEIIVVSPEL